MLYPKCWRNREDCEPIHCIDGVSEELTEEQVMTFDYTPDSFVCSGCVQDPEIKQDKYRLCFKNECSDEMTDNDMMDLTSIMSVCAAAMNLDAIRKVSNGIVELPAEQSMDEDDYNG